MKNTDTLTIKKKVMIVDDDVDITNLAKGALKKSDEFNVMTVNDSELAIDAARKFQPDLMVLDIMMPKLYGTEIAEKMSHDNQLDNIPILYISSLLDSGHTGTTGNPLGSHMYLAKPFNGKDLLTCIQEMGMAPAGMEAHATVNC